MASQQTFVVKGGKTVGREINKIPWSHVNELELTRLFVYPLKSAQGIEVAHAQVTERGLEHDRRFMLVDADGNLVTARQQAKLLTVTTRIGTEHLLLSAPNMPELRVPLEPEGPERQVRVWADWMLGLDVGPEASTWFSHLFNSSLSLVWMPDRAERRMNPGFGPSRLSFADGNPLHLIHESSLSDLEKRVGMPLGVERFRPNLVVRGMDAYAEDGWSILHLDTLELKVHEACARCMMVNLEPVTGGIGLEPLRTMAGHRRQGKQVLFGQHLHALTLGELRVGQRGTAQKL
jgi:uncharacterized protein